VDENGTAITDNEALLLLADVCAKGANSSRPALEEWAAPAPGQGLGLCALLVLYFQQKDPANAAAVAAWAALDTQTVKLPLLALLDSAGTGRASGEPLAHELDDARKRLFDDDVDRRTKINKVPGEAFRTRWTKSQLTYNDASGRARNVTRLRHPDTWPALVAFLQSHGELPPLLLAVHDAQVAVAAAAKQQQELVAPLNPSPDFMALMAAAGGALREPLAVGLVTWGYAALPPADAARRALLAGAPAAAAANCSWSTEGALAGTVQSRCVYVDNRTGCVLAVTVAGAPVPPRSVAALLLSSFEAAERVTLAHPPSEGAGGGDVQLPQQSGDNYLVSWQHTLLFLDALGRARLCTGCTPAFAPAWSAAQVARGMPVDAERRVTVSTGLGYEPWAPSGRLVCVAGLQRPEDALSCCGPVGAHCACGCHAHEANATMGQLAAHAAHVRAAAWVPDSCATCSPGAGLYHLRNAAGAGLPLANAKHTGQRSGADERWHAATCCVLLPQSAARNTALCSPCAGMSKNVLSPGGARSWTRRRAGPTTRPWAWPRARARARAATPRRP